MQRLPRILVVDDDPDILFTVEQILLLEGYEVLRARSGLEALAILEEHQPALILLDLMMPVMDGREFRRRLQNHKAESVPVVVVSADREGDRIAKAIRADGYIAKPFNVDDLVAVVHRFAPLA